MPTLILMEKLKQVLTRFPEYYFVVLAVILGYEPPLSFNPIALGFIFVLILQIVIKNAISGLILAGLLILVNIYMLFALASEFSEFPTVNADAILLLLVGLVIIAVNLTVAGSMISRYSPKEALT
jgi:hypothetical protein